MNEINEAAVLTEAQRKAVINSVTKEYNRRRAMESDFDGLKLAWIEKAINEVGDAQETASHSERDILDGCLWLLKRLTDEFDAYLDSVVGPDADRFCVRMTMFEIVQRLFLMRTDHSGGTSTREKCNELGVDAYKEVLFEAGNEVDEE